MIAVGERCMSAAAAVMVTGFMITASVPAAALLRILGIHFELVFIHVVAMYIVHVAIVKVTLMPIVHYRGVAAPTSMLVCVSFMRLMAHSIGTPCRL